jgi:hypothetical protein
VELVVAYGPHLADVRTVLFVIIASVDQDAIFVYFGPSASSQELVVFRMVKSCPFLVVSCVDLYALFTGFYYRDAD